jgi:hypothetical protein
LRVQRSDGGWPIDVEVTEAQAFRTWAVIDVLRLTGIRHEEPLELAPVGPTVLPAER